jgi:Protein of unknown function (DUF2804)
MPLFRGGRPLKRWRYAGVYDAAVQLCAGIVRVGPLAQTFWAVWDPESKRLRERTRLLRRGAVRLDSARLRVRDADVLVDLTLDAGAPVEVVSPHGSQYIWTRKQGGVRARGVVRLGERERRIDARAVIDESAGYHARATAWQWSAGVGDSVDGRPVAWNLVDGVHDGVETSERTVWVDGTPHPVGPLPFADDLSSVGDLRADAVAVRARRERLLVFASEYEQPFARFSGSLPCAGNLREGWGVMERHDVRW